ASDAIANPAPEARPLGVFGAAWDDSGLHSETFWLGWATTAQYGWNPGAAPVSQTVADFFRTYYGPHPAGLSAIYRGLQEQSRFFQHSWDRVVSKVRSPGYGNPWPDDVVRQDHTLPPPAIPAMPGLDFAPVYSGRYEQLMDESLRFNRENEILREQLAEALPAVERNRYNLEIFQSLAGFLGHHTRMLMDLRSIEVSLAAARDAALHNNAKQAVGHLVSAHRRAAAITADRRQMFANLTTVWEKSRYPRNREVNGRKFLHVMEAVKDHWADRRPDLSYMTAPEESIGLEAWSKKLAAVIQEFAKRNKVAVRGLEELESEE
ncbi:MAG: hypothetical protein NTY38_02060, partial [Acidobacteria bacterium]|nr:hypothetical protein [Acidobacteriota bacterium]